MSMRKVSRSCCSPAASAVIVEIAATGVIAAIVAIMVAGPGGGTVDPFKRGRW